MLKNEETYVILSSKEGFQVDNISFLISYRSIVCIIPKGKRSMKSTPNEPMMYIIIQARGDFIVEYEKNRRKTQRDKNVSK